MYRSARAITGIAAILVFGLGLSGCDIAVDGHGGLGVELTAGKAQDEWTRSYSLIPGARLEVININGRITAEPTEGQSVEVRAERTAKALSDEYELVVTNDGAEALRTLQGERFALVIADMLMPQLSGLAFLGILRREHPHVATMVYTADIQASTVSKATELGAKAFVEKPATPEKIRDAVRKILAEQAATPVTLDDPMTTDALREVFTIGVGRAAAQLSELVYESLALA